VSGECGLDGNGPRSSPNSRVGKSIPSLTAHINSLEIYRGAPTRIGSQFSRPRNAPTCPSKRKKKKEWLIVFFFFVCWGGGGECAIAGHLYLALSQRCPASFDNHGNREKFRLKSFGSYLLTQRNLRVMEFYYITCTLLGGLNVDSTKSWLIWLLISLI